MKQNELEKCFESISPTDEQKQKMLDNILNAKKAPVKRINFKAAASAAVGIAAFAAVFAFGFFNVTDKIQPPVDNTYKVAEKEPKKENSTVNETVKEEPMSDEYAEQKTQKFAVADVEKKTAQTHKQSSVINDEKPVYDNKKADGYEMENVPQSLALEDLESSSSDYSADEYLTQSAPAGFDDGSSNSKSGGGAGGAVASNSWTDYAAYLSDERYSKYVPQTYAEGYFLTYAYADEQSLAANFSNGNKDIYLVVGTDDCGAETVEPDKVASLGSDGQDVTFAVECGNMYAVYTAPSGELGKMYEMITSAEYFGNN